jgi:anti-anti-sigma factor
VSRFSRRPTSHQDPSGVFALRSWRTAGAHVIALAGEFDIAAAADVERELQDAERSGAPLVALDLRELSFLDCSVLRVIAAADQRAPDGLLIVKGPPQVQRVFELCGLVSRLAFVDVLPPHCHAPPPANAGPPEKTARRGEPRSLSTHTGTASRIDQAALSAAVRELRTRRRRRPGR